MAEKTNSNEAGIGHNRGPEGDPIKLRLEESYAAEFARIGELAEAANKLPKEVDGLDALKATAGIIIEVGKLGKELETARKKEKEPFLEGGRTVDTTFSEGRILRLKTISDGLNARITTYNRKLAEIARAEQAKRDAEERKRAEQLRMDAALAAEAGQMDDAADHTLAAREADRTAASAPIKAADVTRTRTDDGALITTHTVVKGRVLDYAKVDLEKLRPFIKPEHIDAAVAAFVKLNKKTQTIAGVEIYDDETARVRA